MYSAKATQKEHRTDSQISVGIIVLYAIVLYIFIIVTFIQRWANIV